MTVKARWQAEKTGCTQPTWLVVLRWGKGPQQDLARYTDGNLIWFQTQTEADAHAALLNEGSGKV